MKKEVDLIFRENMNLEDRETLKSLCVINEAEQNQVLSALCEKLYKSITDKVDDINFGEIPLTKGDITKLSNFDGMMEVIANIHDILIHYRQSTDSINIITSAIENVEKRKDLFTKGFRYKAELVMLTYSTIVLSIVSSVSFLISACVEYIKLPNKDEFEITIDKVALNRSKDNLLFRDLNKFNHLCKDGELDKSLEPVLKNLEKGFLGFTTGAIVGTTALIILITCIVPLLKELIFFFFYTRTQLSDYFDIQANLLQMNIYNVENNREINKEEKKKIIKRQSKILELFRKAANKLEVETKDAEIKTIKAKENDAENKNKYKTKDLLDTMPDSVASKLF